MKKTQLLLIACFLITVFAKAQMPTKNELQKKESELKKEIAELTGKLGSYKGRTEISIREAATIQRKIEAREELVNNINKQVRSIDETIYQNERDIYRMNKEMGVLKTQYAQNLVFAYKNRSSYQYLNFLFSATSFNDALKRMTYLKSYRKLRETQVDNIVKTQNLLQQKMGSLAANKQEQTVTLQNQQVELQNLEKDKKEKDRIVSELKSQEKQISAQLKRKEKQSQAIRDAIVAIIRRGEAEAAHKEKIIKSKEVADAKKIKGQQVKIVAITKINTKSPAATSKLFTSTSKTSETTAYKTNEKNTGKLELIDKVEIESRKFELRHLKWPSNGPVIIPFGKYNAGGQMIGYSEGVEIAIPEGSNVACVADGKVSFAGDVNGEQVIIVKHGKYYTSYSHLSSLNVSKGQDVNAGTVLGKSGTGFDGQGSLYFMINNDKGIALNPKDWLRDR